MRYYAYTFFIFILLSCSKSFLDTQPESSSAESQSYQNINDFNTALNGAYSLLQSKGYYGRNYQVIGEVLADNVVPSETNLSRFISLYNYSHTSSNQYILDFWKTAYEIINAANKIIINTNASEILSDQEKQYFLAHAYSLRALSHYDLFKAFSMNYYVSGKAEHLSIPIISDSSYISQTEPIGNSTAENVINFIENDLKKARIIFENHEFDQYYLNKYAVQALLARVYFSKRDYFNAAFYADSVIKSGVFKLIDEENYIDSWSLSSNSESIFTLQFSANDYPGTESFGYLYSKNGYGDFVPSNDLVSLYSARDVRKKLYGQGFCEKFQSTSNNIGLSNFHIIRLSEMYLIVAEALQTSTVTPGYTNYQESFVISEYLDPIKQRANASTPKTELSGLELLKEIQDECRREFAFEGHRFFNIKRRKNIVERNDCSAQKCALYYYSDDNYLFTLPFPISEINANENLVQNNSF